MTSPAIAVQTRPKVVKRRFADFIESQGYVSLAERVRELADQDEELENRSAPRILSEARGCSSRG